MGQNETAAMGLHAASKRPTAFVLSNPLKTNGAHPKILEPLPGSGGVSSVLTAAWQADAFGSFLATGHSGWNFPSLSLACSSASHHGLLSHLAIRVQPLSIGYGQACSTDEMKCPPHLQDFIH